MMKRYDFTRILRQFAQDERGSITLEFVLWIPFLLFWCVFSLGVFLAMDNRYDSAKATYAISDVLSRYKTPLTRTKIEDLRVLAQQLLPNAATGGAMRISSIEFDQGAYTVQWTECFGDIQPMTDSTIPLSIIPPFMDNKDTVLVTETYIPYLPISDYWLPGALTWRTGVVSRPRFVAKIENNDADTANCDPLPSPGASTN